MLFSSWTRFRSRRRHIARLRRELPAADAQLRMLHHEEQAVLNYQLWYLQRRLQTRLGSHPEGLPQHPPRPLAVPERYSRIACLDTFPVISIVTPSLNQGRFLESAIRSVLNQSYPRLEYIVQDGESTDQTRRALTRYRPILKHLDSRPDSGPAQALNRGLAHASGEILGCLCADDVLLPGTLHYVAGYFARHPKVDVVYGHRVLIDADGSEVGRCVLPRHSARALRWANIVPTETLFWRRRIWNEVGGNLDETLQMTYIWDLLLRFQEAGARIVRLPRFLGACRIHAQRRSRSELTFVAQAERQQLRQRRHSRPIADDEAAFRLIPYLARQAFHYTLYRLGAFRY